MHWPWQSRRIRDRPVRALAERYVAYVRGQTDAESVFAPDAVWEVPGRSQVAGRFVGAAEIDEQLRLLRGLSHDTLRVELDAASDGENPTLWVHVSATRRGRDLDDHQQIRVRVRDDRIVEGGVHPADVQAHDAFWGGTWSPRLTPDDYEILAAAWRADARRPAPGLSGVIALVMATGFGAAVILSYTHLTSTRPPAAANVSTQNVAALTHVTMSQGQPGVDPVRWQLVTSYVGGLNVLGPDTGTASVVLPVLRSSCADVAKALAETCTPAGEIHLTSPVRISWDVPQQLASTDGQTLSARSLDIAPSTDKSGAIRLTVSATTQSRPSVCFSAPAEGTPTMLVTHGVDKYSRIFAENSAAVPCGSGVTLVVGSEGVGQPPALDFAAISSLLMHANADTVSLQGMSGQIAIDPGGPTVLGTPTVVELSADPSDSFSTVLDLERRSPTLTLHSGTATSVLTDTGQLLSSQWERSPGLWVPLLGAAVGALVVTPLGVAVQSLMAQLSQWGHRLNRRVHPRRRRWSA